MSVHTTWTGWEGMRQPEAVPSYHSYVYLPPFLSFFPTLCQRIK